MVQDCEILSSVRHHIKEIEYIDIDTNYLLNLYNYLFNCKENIKDTVGLISFCFFLPITLNSHLWATLLLKHSFRDLGIQYLLIKMNYNSMSCYFIKQEIASKIRSSSINYRLEGSFLRK